MGKRLKLLIFHQSLAPYRIDFWNSLNSLFDLKLYFIYENVVEQKFDQAILRKKLNFNIEYYLRGFQFGIRAVRYGLHSMIKKHKPDIVFTYEYSQITITIILLKKLFGLNFKHYTTCDDSLHIIETCNGVRKIARDFSVKHLDGIITVNKEVSNWYETNFNRKDFCITFPIIPNEDNFRNLLEGAIPESNRLINLHDLEGKKCLFFVGRLVDVKAVDRLLKAFSNIASSFPECRLVIVGQGEEERPLKDLTNLLQIQNKVIFTGRRDGNDLYAWYNIGQIFVLPSYYEPFGAVVSEALLGGATVLCSSFAGASVLIKQNNGTIFNPLDDFQLSDLLKDELSKQTNLEKTIKLRPSKLMVNYESYVTELFEHISRNHQTL